MKFPALALLVVLLVFLSQPALSIHPMETPKGTKTETRPLSASEIREFNKNIQWIQKNSSEIDRRMFDLGSKQFEVSWTIWYSWYLLVALLVAIGGVIYVVLWRALKREVVEAARETMKEETLYLHTLVNRNICFLALQLFEEHQEPLRKRYLEVATEFATKGNNYAEELIKVIEKEAMTKYDRTRFEEYEKQLAASRNNLAYCLSQKADANDSERRDARRLAKAFYEYARKHDHYHLLDSYAWVVIRFGANEAERNQGRDILRELLAREDIPSGWREARRKRYKDIIGSELAP